MKINIGYPSWNAQRETFEDWFIEIGLRAYMWALPVTAGVLMANHSQYWLLIAMIPLILPAYVETEEKGGIK